MKSLIFILLFSTTTFAADFCFTEYKHAAYFFAARNYITCDDGESYEVKNDRFGDGEKGLREKTEKFMNTLGYDLMYIGSYDHYTKWPDIYVKNYQTYNRYCTLSEQKDGLTLECSNSKLASLKSNNKENVLNFLANKDFSKTFTVPKPPKHIDAHINKTVTVFGSNSNLNLCDVSGLESPFDIKCN